MDFATAFQELNCRNEWCPVKKVAVACLRGSFEGLILVVCLPSHRCYVCGCCFGFEDYQF